MANDQIEKFVGDAKMADIAKMVSALIDYHGTHTILALVAADCVIRANDVLLHWQDGNTAQMFQASGQIVKEASDKLMNLAVATF